MFSPAKVNLLLAVTGKRPDGFHDLISLVSPVSFGDELEIGLVFNSGDLKLSCTDSSVPVGEENLVVRAARAFLEAINADQGISIRLEKHIPMEAGLGGGSSNAATTLLLLNSLFSHPLKKSELTGLASGLGSDCPLFLERAPVIMRGRGEVIESLSVAQISQLSGLNLAIFKPSIGISTPWAYGELARGKAYAEASSVESWLENWKSGELGLDELICNSFEAPIFQKFPAFPLLFEEIRDTLGLRCLVSGSGSACFTLMKELDQVEKLRKIVENAFGAGCFFEVCQSGIHCD